MFKCIRCDRTFSRRDSLSRHMKRRVHTRSNDQENQRNNNDQIANNQFEYTTNRSVNNGTRTENERLLTQSESSKSNDEDDDSENDYSFKARNDIEEKEDKSPVFQNQHEDDTDLSKRNSNTFDESMKNAAEAIKRKFDSLKNSHNMLKFVNVEDNRSDEQKHLPSPDNYKETSFTPKMAGLLQTALDILMIKELKNACAKDEEQEDKNSTEKEQPSTSNSINGEAKRLKYEDGNANFHNGHSKEVDEEEYFDDSNNLVDELRSLVTQTQIGEEMTNTMRNLKERRHIINPSFTDYIENEKNRKHFNELKKSDIGRRIVSIIRKLEKRDIIEPRLKYISNEDEDSDEKTSASDNEDIVSGGEYSDDSENTVANDNEKKTVGKGLYLRPYRRR